VRSPDIAFVTGAILAVYFRTACSLLAVALDEKMTRPRGITAWHIVC